MRSACVARSWRAALLDGAAWEGLRISGRDVFSLSMQSLVSLGGALRRAGRPELVGELQLKDYTYPATRAEGGSVGVDVFEFVDVEASNAAESGMKVWTTAQAAAQLFARWPQLLEGNVLELGAGLGTVGAVCGRLLPAGARCVCTDARDPDHPHVLRFLEANLRLNGGAVADELSWGAGAAQSVAARHGPFHTVLGFDVVYSDAVDLLAETIDELLTQVPAAMALVGFCERFAEREERFVQQAEARGLSVAEASWSALLAEPGEAALEDGRDEDVPPALRARLMRGAERPPRPLKSLWLKLLLRYLGLHLLVLTRA